MLASRFSSYGETKIVKFIFIHNFSPIMYHFQSCSWSQSITLQVIKENNYRPYVLVNDRIVEEFAEFDQSDPDIVVRHLLSNSILNHLYNFMYLKRNSWTNVPQRGSSSDLHCASFCFNIFTRNRNIDFNSQIVGDAEEHFNYEKMDKPFKLLVGGKQYLLVLYL